MGQDAQDSLIIKFYNDYPLTVLQGLLPDRTGTAITTRAKKMAA